MALVAKLNVRQHYTYNQMYYEHCILNIVLFAKPECVRQCALCPNSPNRAGLSILGALGKFNSSGAPRAIHSEALVHYSTFRKQHINLRLHACKYSINIVCKKHGKLLLLCTYCCFCRLFHITMKVCLEL